MKIRDCKKPYRVDVTMDFPGLPWINRRGYSPEPRRLRGHDDEQGFEHFQEFNYYQEKLQHVTQGFYESVFEYTIRVKRIAEIIEHHIDADVYSSHLANDIRRERNRLKVLGCFIDGLRRNLVNYVWHKKPTTFEDVILYALEAEELFHAHVAQESNCVQCYVEQQRAVHLSTKNRFIHDSSMSQHDVEQISRDDNNLTNFRQNLPQFEPDLETGEEISAKLTPAMEAQFWMEHEVDEFALKCSRPCHSSSSRTKAQKSTSREHETDKAVKRCDNFREKYPQLSRIHPKSEQIYDVRTASETEVAAPAEFPDAAQYDSSPARTLPASKHMDNELDMAPKTSDLIDVMTKMFDFLINIEDHPPTRPLGTRISRSPIDYPVLVKYWGNQKNQDRTTGNADSRTVNSTATPNGTRKGVG